MKPTSLELPSFTDPEEVVHCGLCPRDQRICIMQRFSTGVLQEFFSHAIPNYLFKTTLLFSLRPPNNNNNKKKLTTSNTTKTIL